MKKILLLVLSLFAALALSAQTDSLRLVYSARGTVTDLRTGRPIESVHVSVPDRHYATVTNADGAFTIKSDAPLKEVVFSYLGYKTLRQSVGNGIMKVYLVPEAFLLDEAMVIDGDPREIVNAAVSRIADNYAAEPELLECFYRETIRKKQRFTYISEAVARIYKTGYDRHVSADRAALEKSRVLLSQRRSDTLSIKVMGGPTQAVTHDLVKNPEPLLAPEELKLYEFSMGNPVYIDSRPQFVIHIRPGTITDYALYEGDRYIDRETLTFTRLELSLDMTDSFKAARMMLVRKPLALRFTPKELSMVVTYRMQDGRSRLEYFRSTMRFNCDWKKRLIATSYTAVNELVVTNLRQPAVQIPRAEMFRTSDILNDKAKEFLDPDFWKDYNIIEPDETLEHAIDRLKKRR